MSHIEEKVKSLTKKINFYMKTLHKNTDFDVTYDLIMSQNEEIASLYIFIVMDIWWDGENLIEMGYAVDKYERNLYNFFHNKHNLYLTKYGDFKSEENISTSKDILNVMGPILSTVNFNRRDESLKVMYEILLED